TPWARLHSPPGTLCALPPAAPRSYPSPLTAILPNRQDVEGAAARAAKSLNAGRGGGPMAVTEPDRSQSPRCPCKAPPKFYHPMVRPHRRRTAPDYLSLWRSIGSNAIGRIETLTSAPINQMVCRPQISGAGEESLRSLPRPFLSPPDSGRVDRTTATHPRCELARPLNHWPASATNEWVNLGGSTC